MILIKGYWLNVLAQLCLFPSDRLLRADKRPLACFAAKCFIKGRKPTQSGNWAFHKYAIFN